MRTYSQYKSKQCAVMNARRVLMLFTKPKLPNSNLALTISKVIKIFPEGRRDVVGLNQPHCKILDSICGLIVAKALVKEVLSLGESKIIFHFPYLTLIRSNEGAGEERRFREGSMDFIVFISIARYLIKPD